MGRNSRIRSLSLGSTNIVLRNRDRENSNEMINLLTKRIVKSSSYDEMKEIQELLIFLRLLSIEFAIEKFIIQLFFWFDKSPKRA